MAAKPDERSSATSSGARARPRRRGEPAADLQPYEAHEAELRLGLTPLAVGWLDRRWEFPTGAASLEFRLRLWRFCRTPLTIGQARAAQPCPLCGQVVQLTAEGETVTLGSAEIRVMGATDVFAAPDLIYHYVLEHHYRPPEAFIQAVLSGPSPDSAEHRAFMRALR